MLLDFRIEKDKYLQIAQTQGVPEALTQLHHRMIQWELEAFEGEKGYQPQLWKELEQFREFSRELWEKT